MLAIGTSPGAAALRRIGPAAVLLSPPSVVALGSGPSDYGVTISWVSPEMHPFGFLVELYNETTPASPEQYMSGPDETSHEFLSLTTSATYSGRVTTLGDGVAYLDSAAQVSVNTVSPQAPQLEPVSNFIVSNDGSGYLTLTWIDPGFVPYTMRIVAEQIGGAGATHSDFSVGAGFQSASIDLTYVANEEVRVRMWNVGDGVNWRDSTEASVSFTVNGG